MIPHGTLLQPAIPKANAKAALGLDPDAPLIVNFGYFEPSKNIHILLEAFRIIKEGGQVQLDPVPAIGVFLDRVNVLSEIKKFIDNHNKKLLILQGIPKMGKTSVIAKAVIEFRTNFKDVLWIDCKPENITADILLSQLDVFLKKNGGAH